MPTGYAPRHTLAALLVVGIAAIYFATFVHYGILLEDEGLLLQQIARTFHGERPYVDFHTGYPPATFYLNAALFRLFGVSVVPVRWMLVAVNSTSVGLLFALARPVAGTALAATVALGWAAYMPVFVGLFAAFNVPYPSWYGTCAFLAAQVAFDRHLVTGRRRALIAAGIAAGVGFAFKQNAGALAGLACGLTLAFLHAGRTDPERHLARTLLVLAAGFLLAGFTVAVTTVESAFILGPTVVLIAGRLLWATGSIPHPTGRLAMAIALLAATMVAVSLPWLLPFLATLGLSGLLREIFLVGTDFDLVYAIPYPIPVGLPGGWAAAAAVGLIAFGLVGMALRRERVRSIWAAALALGAIACGGALLTRWARFPEGLARSVMLQVGHIGFFAAPLLYLVTAMTFLRSVRANRPLSPQLLGILVFALCMYAELYPRIDSTHLLIALPSGLVLAAWATARTIDAWASALRVSPRLLTGAAIATCVVLALAATLPSLSAVVVVRDGTVQAAPGITVASAAAPVVLEESRGSDVRALNALLAWLRARLKPGEPIFGFPAVALVPFLLDHPSATRHDYWYAGRPDHLEEAEVVRVLTADPPRFVVTVNRNLGFFSNSARYYFILRAFVQEHYVLAARLGRYDVLRRRDLPAEPVTIDDFTPVVGDDLGASLADPMHEARRAAVLAFLARAPAAGGVASLAATVAGDEATQLLLLRAFAQAPDARTVPYLADVFAHGGWRVRNEAAAALNYTALHASEHRYVLGRRDDDPELTASDLVSLVDPATVRTWLGATADRRIVGTFAAWLLAATPDPDAIPILQAAKADTNDPYFETIATYALVRAGRLEYVCDLVQFLGQRRHEMQDATPSLLIDLAAEHPSAVASCLRRGIVDSTARGREVSAWTAGAARLDATAPALRDALHDPEPRVRAAATWALERLDRAAP
ncbi:MAG TPA: glycosyltransferase family 39 protein [Candidatus Binatia bacterium]|jgi:hypothetical protein|nr:glycosyltransferase family 39 protein [Candidatus Binatia bacterium]